MAEPKKKPDDEAEVWNAIAAFEQILEAMPEDRVALESLYEAYQKIGDHATAHQYLLRLARVVANEQDEKAAATILDQLQKIKDQDPETKQLIEQLFRLTQKKEAPAARPQRARRPKPVGITAELSLAWKLLEAGHIKQEEYDLIVNDLSENSAKQLDTPVTVLHVLEDREFRQINSILAYLSKDSGLPIIPLSRFEITPECVDMLPIEVIAHRGAIVFDTMGRDALVAVLNPYDEDLQKEVAQLVGRKCHFFLTPASEYDAALADIRARLQAEKKEQDTGPDAPANANT